MSGRNTEVLPWNHNNHNQFCPFSQCPWRSWVILNSIVVLLSFLYIFAQQLLKTTGQTTDISKAARVFAIWVIPQLFAYAMNFPIAKCCQVLTAAEQDDGHGGDIGGGWSSRESSSPNANSPVSIISPKRWQLVPGMRIMERKSRKHGCTLSAAEKKERKKSSI
ncbi:hypothetical protein TB2_008329 [Malus domestica]